MTSANSIKFAAIHLGPRLHYAVPEVLEEAGILQAVYTDAQAGLASLRPLSWVPRKLQPVAARRLLSRRIPSTIPKGKVHSWIWPSLQIEMVSRFHPQHRKTARYWHQQKLGGHWLADRAVADGFSGANCLYVHPCVSTEAIREAKRRGMFVVLEAISHPFNKKVEKAEYEHFGMPGPEPESELLDNISFFQEEASMADLVLAASPYVKEGLVELGVEAGRIRIVPYGLDSAFFQTKPNPQPGRILYVGKIGYLKGIPYLAKAAKILRERGVDCEIRAVGPCDARLMNREEFAGLNYAGQVPRSEVGKEFLSADLFVFPTLSDGFGIVLLEALAAKLPIIATANCGQVVEEGMNGFCVPTRSPVHLADRMQQIVCDRTLRANMSKHSAEVANRFSTKTYRGNLTDAIFSAYAEWNEKKNSRQAVPSPNV